MGRVLKGYNTERVEERDPYVALEKLGEKVKSQKLTFSDVDETGLSLRQYMKEEGKFDQELFNKYVDLCELAADKAARFYVEHVYKNGGNGELFKRKQALINLGRAIKSSILRFNAEHITPEESWEEIRSKSETFVFLEAVAEKGTYRKVGVE